MKKPYILLLFLFTVMVTLSIVRIALVNTISTTGIDLVAIQQKNRHLIKENKILEEQYLQAASYTTITKKAKAMGFTPSKTHINIASPLPLAIRQ